ncbi:hypothetical protein [Frankia sp. AgKG'84/4]|nr:hypothetical protein [Frankia sp. AgKG'84/4]
MSTPVDLVLAAVDQVLPLADAAKADQLGEPIRVQGKIARMP